MLALAIQSSTYWPIDIGYKTDVSFQGSATADVTWAAFRQQSNVFISRPSAPAFLPRPSNPRSDFIDGQNTKSTQQHNLRPSPLVEASSPLPPHPTRAREQKKRWHQSPSKRPPKQQPGIIPSPTPTTPRCLPGTCRSIWTTNSGSRQRLPKHRRTTPYSTSTMAGDRVR